MIDQIAIIDLEDSAILASEFHRLSWSHIRVCVEPYISVVVEVIFACVLLHRQNVALLDLALVAKTFHIPN